MGSREKPGSGSELDTQIDRWLQDGGVVLASSERARRFLTSNYHRARREQGLAAWPSPAILDWQTFLRTTWQDRANSSEDEDRLVLDSVQERSVWADIAGSEERFATALPGPRNRVAVLAQKAHQLLCGYAPKFLRNSSRSGWQQDAAVFSGWLKEFDSICNTSRLLSATRLPLELTSQFEAEAPEARSARTPLLLVGFDRLLPTQRRLLDLWGEWKMAAQPECAETTSFYRAAEAGSELAACVQWCKQNLAANPDRRLLVITPKLAENRGEIERAFLDLDRSGRTFEFSLGIPLSKTALARSASVILHWLSSLVAESDLDWLFSSGFAITDAAEAASLQSYMLGLRRSGLERPQWSLSAFLNQNQNATLPQNWVRRIDEARKRLSEQSNTSKSPLEWSEYVQLLLQKIGWPGSRALSSDEFQVVRRWEAALESCAALGFDGRRIQWREFLISLSEALEETLFAPETHEAPIQITGPAESAGLTADGIWFMGATEDAWPASGSTHPLLPIEVQRETSMPHATAQVDWDLTNSMTNRLLSSASEVCFSFARQGEDADARPSRLILSAIGAPQELPDDLRAQENSAPVTTQFEDYSHISFGTDHVEGGSSILTFQTQCPFKAFAVARLGARGWNAAEPCLTAAQRGQLLHAVLHSIWGGIKTGGIRTLAELRGLRNREQFIAEHVSRALQKEIKRAVRERLPERYLELEEQRLLSLIAEWLEFELTRVEFEVVKTEDKQTLRVAGLAIDVRLDRVDRLSDGSLLVIDYKTGQVTTKSWDLPRPDDVQLPLYAGFGLSEDEVPGGLAFAEVRRGDGRAIKGFLKDARTTLFPSLRNTNGLAKNRLDDGMIQDWKRYIENLAKAFLLGNADVDPHEYPKTCERCDLHAVCRVQEQRAVISEDEEAGEEVADE